MKLKLHFILPVFLLISGSVFSVPLSGVYTIGGSSPSYATFTAAVNDLNTFGVNGPVIFNVRPGTYTEHLLVNAITGASATNDIIFESESGVASDVTITYAPSGTSDDYVFYLNGASHITFSNLTVTAMGATYAKAFVLKNGSTNINFFGNILNCGLTSWQVTTIFVIDASPSNGLNNDSIVLTGNQINGGSVGYETEGAGTGENNGLVIKNNTFSNTSGEAINIGYCNNALIQANNFEQGNASSGTYSISILNHCDQLRILDNNINCGIGNGIAIDSAGVSGKQGLIANNFIAAQVAFATTGASYQLVYNNTIYAEEFVVLFRGGTGNVFENNIAYNYNDLGSGVIFDSPVGSFITCDYNDYYIVGQYFGFWGATPSYSLAGWQAASGLDAHSRTVLPPFVSDTDFRLTNCDSLRFGVPLALVPYDIDSNLRSLTTTVVGAYECPAVQPLSAQFTASDTNVCRGASIIFTDQTANQPNSWNWTFYGGIPHSSDSQNPTVYYDTAGVYSVKLVVSNTSGRDSLTKTGYIKVNPSPSAGIISLSSDTVCAGNSTLLTVTGSTGNIQWQSSAPLGSFSDITGADSSTYNTGPLSQSSEYRLIVMQGACTDTSNPVTISVNPLPAMPALTTTDSIICSNDSTKVCTADTFAAYLWNTGNISYCTTVNAAGSYWVTVTDANHCSAVSNHQQISVYPVPSVSVTVQGDTLSSFGEVSYQWYFNDNPILDATGSVYIAGESGNYSLEVTDTNGCKTSSSNTYVAVTGITQPVENNTLTIYPDPFTNTIFIKDDETGAVIQNIKIYDVLGRIALNNEYNNSTPLILPVDVTALPSAAYYIRVETNQSLHVRSIIKD